MLEVTGVQTYIINSARVVFLNERPQPRPGKGGVTNTSDVCFLIGCRLVCVSFRLSRNVVSNRFAGMLVQIAGTGNDRSDKKSATKNEMAAASDSEESYTGSTHVTQSFSPSTRPPAVRSYRSSKRRKGIPHRAPFESLVSEV
ncbi:hypothetical protein GW17_00058730 [Ensete ventricosum]|nr:hypothetical protein GW17_00058730 [Ensete ventricosum]